ncbi:hypothetical protein FOZ63_019701 [Perkinsus olseni]|uniref:Uncharacterized protein n=1 Tax=Perkinsus olseni TaxID=32597 RepID=A0A7J6TW03_PEROL|nr:hypothetical protein FOZ63_019701 [Perkinsus olseni]
MAAIEDAALKKRGQYQSYPSSTRTKVVQAAMEGNPWRDVARALGVKMSTARSWVKSGRTACLPRGGKVVEPKRKISEEYGDFIFQVFRRSPTTTFAEVGRLLRRRFNLQIDPTNISRYMKKEEKFKEILKLRQMRPRGGGSSLMAKPTASEPRRTTSELLRSGPIQSCGRFDQLPVISRRPTSSTLLPRMRKSRRLSK